MDALWCLGAQTLLPKLNRKALDVVINMLIKTSQHRLIPADGYLDRCVAMASLSRRQGCAVRGSGAPEAEFGASGG